MLKIGHIELDLPVIQAALSGYSDWPMRAVAKSLGAPYTICEVMIDSFVNSLKDRERTRHFLMVTDDDHPAGAQLMGAVPDEFPAAALKLVDAGFDVIDINFGCPVKKVLGRCRGGFHLGQPVVAKEIIRRVRDAVPDDIPVTLKMRRGIDDSAESEDLFYKVLNAAFDEGLAAVAIHGRTVTQRYVGPSDWSFLADVKRQFSDKTILGSGDLYCAEDCVRMMKETGVDGVTAARGSIGNPWIFAQARSLLNGNPLPLPPDVFEQRRVIERHLDFATQVYSLKRAVKQLRKFGMRYADWHPEDGDVRAAFIGVKDAVSFKNVLEVWYSQNAAGSYPKSPGLPKPPKTRAISPPTPQDSSDIAEQSELRN